MALIHAAGYSGVAIYTRNSKCCPIRAEEGVIGVLCPPKSSIKFRDLPEEQQIGGYPREDQLLGPIDEAVLDSEGRTVILEFPAFVLIGVYVPATRDDSRTDFRIGFLSALDARIRNLVAMGKQVILAGDLNIIRSDIDTAGCAEQLRKEGMTLEDFISTPSRRLLNQLIFEGQVIGERDEGREEPVMWDITREFHHNRQGMFTCWETKKNARPGNYGSRIDYILCTAGIKNWFEDSNIQEGLMGSDHCPVYATFADLVKQGENEYHIEDLMNPEDMFKDGKRLRPWSTKDLLQQSAKLLTEFDRRRSIKDMFTKKTPNTQPEPSAIEPDTLSASIDASKTLRTQSSITVPSSTPPMTAPTVDSPLVTALNSSDANASPSAQHKMTDLTSPTSSSAQRISAKRPASSISTQPSKKTKSAVAKDKNKPGPGQSSLRGFFKPKTPAPDTSPKKTQSDGSSLPAPTTAQTATSVNSSPVGKPPPLSFHFDGGNQLDEDVDTTPAYLDHGDSEVAADEDKVFDPIESKESWSKLLGKKRPAPLCEHEDPCISYVTKKPGVNKGEQDHGGVSIVRHTIEGAPDVSS